MRSSTIFLLLRSETVLVLVIDPARSIEISEFFAGNLLLLGRLLPKAEIATTGSTLNNLFNKLFSNLTTEFCMSLRRIHRRLATIESLETRAMLTATLTDGVLNVVGTDQADAIRVGISGASRNQGSRKLATEAAAQLFSQNGGVGEVISLPEDLSIYGNTHLMMQDNNSKFIANLMIDWLALHASL